MWGTDWDERSAVTRRLTLAILGTVVAALALTGGVALALTRLSAEREAEEEARRRAEAVAAVLQLAGEAVQGRMPIREQLAVVTERLRLQDVGLVVFRPEGGVADDAPTELPEGVDAADLDEASLRAGLTVSGSDGSLVYAAAPVAVSQGGTGTEGPPPAQALAAVVVTGTPSSLVDRPAQWFALAAGLALVAACIVAYSLGRRLSHPLREATRATRRIADGDLEVRLPVAASRRPDELAELALAVNQTAESLARSHRLEQQFLLSVSHDLRTPLTSIRGYAEAIVDGAAPDERQAAGIILSEAQRLERLVRDLLDLARLDAHRFRLHTEPVALSTLCQQVVISMTPAAEAAGVTLATIPPDGTVPPEEVTVRADPDRLAQVVGNLVDNALRFARTRVVVEVTSHQGRGRLRVSDDGPGIDAEDLPRVFERLYVARHQPSRRESGSGLGLAIVRELVEAMGGGVTAGDAPNGGASLEVWLPCSDQG